MPWVLRCVYKREGREGGNDDDEMGEGRKRWRNKNDAVINSDPAKQQAASTTLPTKT